MEKVLSRMDKGKKEIFADLHVHSMYSPSCLFKGYASQSKIEDILKAAKKKGLAGIAIADHDRIKGSLEAARIAKNYGIVAVPSVEVSCGHGHIIALNVRSPIKKGMGIRETIERIHELGGLAVCPHPLMAFFGVGRKNIRYFDGVECANGREGRQISAENCKKRQFITGGSDAHTLNEIGNAVTVFTESFSSIDEMLELLRKCRSECRIIKKTSKSRDIVIPQLKNIKDYHKQLLLKKIKKNKKTDWKSD